MPSQIAVNQPVIVFEQPIRWYIDRAELPIWCLGSSIILTYIVSFWWSVSYLNFLLPLVFVEQLISAVVVSYVVGVRHKSSLVQVSTVVSLVAGGAGVVSGIMAVIRFWYPWLILNVIIEPVWSIILSSFVAVITYGFFHLALHNIYSKS